MEDDFKISLLKIAYLAFLMDIAWFGGIREGKTATIIKTGEVYTIDQIEQMFGYATNNS